MQELRQVTAEDIYRWAKFRVYGDPDTDKTATPPVNYRHSTVLAWKKGISHFMPNGHLHWNKEHSSGNPTKSRLITRLLRHMKRFQAQLRGRPARARRSFTQQEWEQFMELVWELDDPQIRLCASAYFPFMLHYITRLDDASKIYVRNLTG